MTGRESWGDIQDVGSDDPDDPHFDGERTDASPTNGHLEELSYEEKLAQLERDLTAAGLALSERLKVIEQWKVEQQFKDVRGDISGLRAMIVRQETRQDVRRRKERKEDAARQEQLQAEMRMRTFPRALIVLLALAVFAGAGAMVFIAYDTHAQSQEQRGE